LYFTIPMPSSDGVTGVLQKPISEAVSDRNIGK
jgi:hypothetical protein